MAGGFTLEALRLRCDERPACKIMVELLALAYERSCEAELAGIIESDLNAGRLPDLAILRARLRPLETPVPHVTVALAPLGTYDEPSPRWPAASPTDAEPAAAGNPAAIPTGEIAHCRCRPRCRRLDTRPASN